MAKPRPSACWKRGTGRTPCLKAGAKVDVETALAFSQDLRACSCGDPRQGGGGGAPATYPGDRGMLFLTCAPPPPGASVAQPRRREGRRNSTSNSKPRSRRQREFVSSSFSSKSAP